MLIVDTTLVSQLAVAAVALYTLVTAAGRATDRLLAIARTHDLPETLVGMTLVALGTLIESNLVNPLLGVGTGAIISIYAVPPVIVLWDLPFKLLIDTERDKSTA